MTFPDGEIYKGTWKDDRKHGFGILITSAGEKYEGQWDQGEFMGETNQ